MPNADSVAIVFIHGLAKKPSMEKLQEIWLWALGRDNPMPATFAAPNRGIDLQVGGVPQRFNYYADVFYGTQYETDFASYYEAAVEDDDSTQLHRDGLDRIEPELQLPQPVTPRERAFVRNFEAKLMAQAVLSPSPTESEAEANPQSASDNEIAAWLPAPVKQAIIKKAAMESYYFLFDKEYTRPDGVVFKVRQELRQRLLTELAAAKAQAERLVIVAHSMGTMIAYDVLRNCPGCPAVDTLITIGSPLGVREVQEELIAVDAADVDFPAAKLRRWVNIYDPLDPVAGADPKLANDYAAVDGKSIEDIKESNWGSWRHTVTHYLAGTRFRAELSKACGLS